MRKEASGYEEKIQRVKKIADKLKNSETGIDEAILLLEDAATLFREILEEIESGLPKTFEEEREEGQS
jgi:exonuclease VII small subunit